MTTTTFGRVAAPSSLLLHVIACITWLVFTGTSVALCQAQSDPSNFSTVINVPPDLVSEDTRFPDTQLNIFDGAEINAELEVGGRFVSNAEVNIYGGVLGWLQIHRGARGNLLGGSIRDRTRVFDTMRIAGGTFGTLETKLGSLTTIAGGDFRIDGIPVDGLDAVGSVAQIDIPENGLLTGTLADGVPFAVTTTRFDDSIAPGSLTLEAVELPPVVPGVIVASTDRVPLGIRSGQTLRVDDGGIVSNNFNAGIGSRVQVEPGGSVGYNFEATGAEVTVSGGEIRRIRAFRGSKVNISGGEIRSGIEAFEDSVIHVTGGYVDDFDTRGSTVHISGGQFGIGSSASEASILEITGGSFKYGFILRSGSKASVAGGDLGRFTRVVDDSTLELTGGALGEFFQTSTESTVQISGGDFRLNGSPIDELAQVGASQQVDIPDGVVLSGILADGTPFGFFARDRFDAIADGSLTLRTVSLPAIGPSLITASTDFVPQGIRDGQTLVIDDGSTMPGNFSAGFGSTVRIEEGGSIGRNLEATGAEVFVAGGTVDRDFRLYCGATALVSAGSTISNVSLTSGSTLNVEGGIVRDIYAFDGATVNLFGSGFAINGVDITSSLIRNTPFTIESREGSLSGVLTDGTPFSYPLNIHFNNEQSSFVREAKLTVTLIIPEPTGVGLLLISCVLFLWEIRNRYV